MASKVFEGSIGTRNHTLRLTLTESTQSIANNTTLINWKLEVYRSNYKPWGYDGTYSVTVDGTTESGSFNYDFRNYSYKLIATGSKTVSHNSDGTKTISASSSIYLGSAGGSGSNSGSFTLTTIPRATQPTVSPTSANTASTVTIGHDGASSSFRHDVDYSIGGSGYVAIASNVSGNSTSWVPPHSLLPSTTSGTATIRLYTRSSSGGTIIGTKYVNVALYVPSSIKPSVSSVSWDEAQTSSPDIEAMMGGVSGSYVQRWSKLRPTVSAFPGSGSSLTSRSVTQAGQSTSSGSAFSQPVSLSGSVSYSATASDARGRNSSVYSNTVSVAPYNFPNLPTPSVTRVDGGGTPSSTGTNLRIIPLASVSSLVFGGSQKNLIEYQIRTKPTGGSYTTIQAWTASAGTTWVDTYITGGGYAANTGYIVEVSIRDVFGKNGYDTGNTVKSLEVPVPTESVFMDWDQGEGIGLGKYRTPGRMLDVFGQIYQNNGKAVLDEENIAALDGIPFAMAAGYAEIGSPAVSVTFPSGRFTVRPMVTAQMQSGGPDAAGVSHVEATSFDLRNASSSSSRGIYWIAVQMTSGSGSG